MIEACPGARLQVVPLPTPPPPLGGRAVRSSGGSSGGAAPGRGQSRSLAELVLEGRPGALLCDTYFGLTSQYPEGAGQDYVDWMEANYQGAGGGGGGGGGRRSKRTRGVSMLGEGQEEEMEEENVDIIVKNIQQPTTLG